MTMALRVNISLITVEAQGALQRLIVDVQTKVKVYVKVPAVSGS